MGKLLAIICLCALFCFPAFSDEGFEEANVSPHTGVRCSLKQLFTISLGNHDILRRIAEGEIPQTFIIRSRLVIESLDQGGCPLTETQKEKLLLAAKGEFHRIYHQFLELGAEYCDRDLTEVEVLQLNEELGSLSELYRHRAFSKSSLFGKTLANILTEEQRIQFQQIKDRRYRAFVEHLMHDAVGGKSAISESSQKKIVDLIVKESRVFPRGNPNAVYLLFFEMEARLVKIRSLLNAEEWGRLEPIIKENKKLELEYRRCRLVPEFDDDEELK